MHKKRTDSNDVANLAKNDTLGFHALKNSEKIYVEKFGQKCSKTTVCGAQQALFIL